MKRKTFWAIIPLALTFVLCTGIQQAHAQRAIIALKKVKIYSLPMLDDAPIAVLARGDTVRVIGQRGDWVKIGFNRRDKGWMQLQVGRDEVGARNGHRNGTASRASTQTEPAAGTNGSSGPPQPTPDIVRKPDRTLTSSEGRARSFGYTFGMGLMEADFTYNWKFIFHTTPRLALVGSFKHVLGEAADSYLILANLSYLLKEKQTPFLPFVTGGMGIINTVPDRSIDLDSVSHMTLNYGLGARKHLRGNLSLLVNLTQYTVFVGKGIDHFRELTVGLLVGRFWE